MAEEKLSTTAKKALQQVNAKANDVYNKAIKSGPSTYWPNMQAGKFVSAAIYKQTATTEAEKAIEQLKGNMEDADIAAVRRNVQARIASNTAFYENYLRTKSPNSVVSDPTKAGATAPGVQEAAKAASYDTDPEKTSVRSKKVSEWAYTNNTYSMCDIVCTIDVSNQNGEHVVQNIGRLQTLSYSIYQNKQPVRVLGRMNAKDYVYGQRTIAGSLVFAVFNKHWLIDIYDQLVNNGAMKNWHYVADEMPPFDITVSFANEHGYDSKMAIYGVRLMTEGQVMSINDIYIENTYQFVATDIEYMDALNAWQKTDKIGRRWTDTKAAGIISSKADKSTTNKQDGINDKQKMIGQSTSSEEKKNDTSSAGDKKTEEDKDKSLVDYSQYSLTSESRLDMQTALTKAYNEACEEINKQVEDGEITPDQADKKREELRQQYASEQEYIDDNYRAL